MSIKRLKQPLINKGGNPKDIKTWIDDSYLKDSRKDQVSEMIKQIKLTKMFPIWSESLKKEELMPPQDGPSLPEEVPQPKTPKKNKGAMTESGQKLTNRYDPPLPEFQPLPELPQGGRGIHYETSLSMLKNRSQINVADPEFSKKFLSAIEDVSQTIPVPHVNLLRGVTGHEDYLGSGETRQFNHGSSTVKISKHAPDISGALKAAIGHAVWNHALDDTVRNAVKAHWTKLHESGRQSKQPKRPFAPVQYGDYSGEEQYFVNNYQKFYASPESRQHLEATNKPMYKLIAALHNVVPKLDRERFAKRGY